MFYHFRGFYVVDKMSNTTAGSININNNLMLRNVLGILHGYFQYLYNAATRGT